MPAKKTSQIVLEQNSPCFFAPVWLIYVMEDLSFFSQIKKRKIILILETY